MSGRHYMKKSELFGDAKTEARAIQKRRAAELSSGLTDNEIAQKLKEARGTGIPAFSPRGQVSVVKETLDRMRPRYQTAPMPEKHGAAMLPIRQKTTSDGKAIDESGCMFDSGWYTKGQHPGFTRTA